MHEEKMNNEHELSQETEQNSEQHTVTTCEEQLQTLQDKVRYLTADFDNYRRRQDREISRRVGEARSPLLRDILSLVDDLERAEGDLEAWRAHNESSTAAQQLHAGIDLIRKNGLRILERHGVKALPTEGIFDPNKHEALLHVTGKNIPAGTIVDTFEKGYECNGELLRPARVSVASDATD